MAFFGLFKSKEERELDNIIQKTMKMIFPGGEKDIARDCERVNAITRGKFSPERLRGFVSGCKTRICTSDGNESDATHISSIMVRSQGCLTENEANDIYVYLEGEARYYDAITLQFKQFNKEFELNEDILGKTPWIYSVGTKTDEISGGYGEYGLAVTNPIPTISIRGTNHYLGRLRYSGRPVQSNRVGSTSSEVTPGSIDIYKLSSGDKDIGSIYICPYHKRNSRKAPKGFTLTMD